MIRHVFDNSLVILNSNGMSSLASPTYRIADFFRKYFFKKCQNQWESYYGLNWHGRLLELALLQNVITLLYVWLLLKVSGRVLGNFNYRKTYNLSKFKKCNIEIFKSRPCALVSYPGSGNTWLRYLVEATSGIFTGMEIFFPVVVNFQKFCIRFSITFRVNL
jgi:hypothetical protein